MIRNPLLIKSRVSQIVILALFIGGVFFQIDNDYTK